MPCLSWHVLYHTAALLFSTPARRGRILAHPRIVRPPRNATTPPCRPTLLTTRITAIPAAWPPGSQPSPWLLLAHTPTEVNQAPRSHAAPPKVLSLARRPVQAATGSALGSRRGAERRCRTRALSRVRRDFDPHAHGRARCASVKILSGAPAKCGSGDTATQRPMSELRMCAMRRFRHTRRRICGTITAVNQSTLHKEKEKCVMN